MWWSGIGGWKWNDTQMYLNVFRVHTDGVVLSKPMKKLPLGDGIGGWKVEKGGACDVVNANVVE